MIIHESLSNNLSIEHRNVLDISMYWDWEWTARIEEFAAQIVYISQSLKTDKTLPCTPYTGTNYGRDCLLGRSFLSYSQKELVKDISDLLMTDQVMRSQLSMESEQISRLH